MRLAALTSIALGLSVTVAAGAGQAPHPARSLGLVSAPGGSLSVEGGRGLIQITGKGVLVGRMDKGSLEIVDLSANDQWSPRVSGVPRGRIVSLRGKNVSFYVPGGRYRLTAKGVGISISARGAGTVALTGDPDPVGDTGSYAIGDATPGPLPVAETKLAFGPGESGPPSS